MADEQLERLQAALADRYAVQRELGSGGMATVYLAEDLKHKRKVAVKVLRPELAAALGHDRFLREITTTANLRHPHILPLYDSGEASGFLFYVMPYVEGESLRDRLDREKQLPLDEALQIAREVSDALSYAHSRGVMHRDIKPENILLESGHAVVADFGIARAVDAAGGDRLTETGMSIGTPAYMSPEQAAGGSDLDGRSDLYALACVLYEMLGGQAPFTGPTVESLVHQHLSVDAPPITNLRPAVPATVASALQRALAKTPADRFNPVAQFSEAIAQGPATAPAVPAGVAYSGLRVYGSLGAVLLVLLLGWAGWRAFRPKPLSIESANIRQVTRETEPEIHVAISPDGREVAYASGYPGNTHIMVRDITRGRPLALTGDWQGGQAFPAWTPDGRSILFTNQRAMADHDVGPWKVPRLGGQFARPDSVDLVAMDAGVTVVVRGDTAIALRADGSETLLRVGMTGVHSRTWRRDGSAVAYVVGNDQYLEDWGNVAPSVIWVVPMGGTPVRVTDRTSLNVSPAWLPDGSLLYVSNRDGARDIYAVRLDGSGVPRERPVRLTTGLGAYSVSVSGDGNTAAYERFVLRRNIHAIPIPRSGSVSLREARPLTSGNQTIENLDLSADGEWIVFDSNLEGNQDLFVMRVTGGEPRRVTRDPGDDFSPDFSPDGSQIAFHTTRNGNREIYLINTDGSGERRLTVDEEQSYNPAFSPDGLRIAYGNRKVPATIDMLRREARDAPWQAPERLPIEGVFAPRWSPDGSRLVYVIRGGSDGIGIMPLDGTPRRVISAGTAGLRALQWPEWSADGQAIYFRAFDPDGIEGVYEVATNGGTPRLLVRFDDPAMSVFTGAVLAGNGMFYFAVGEIESDIYVMDLVRR